MTEAPVEELLIESAAKSGRTDVFRVTTAKRWPALPPLNRLEDQTVNSFGGGLLLPVLGLFPLGMGCIFAFGLDGAFEGDGPTWRAFVALAGLAILYVAGVTFRLRVVLSNRQKVVRIERGGLGWRRRAALAYASFAAVTLRNDYHPGGSSSTRPGVERGGERYEVVLQGAEPVDLGNYGNPFEARRRAEQVAAYMGLPVVETTPPDPEAVPTYTV